MHCEVIEELKKCPVIHIISADCSLSYYGGIIYNKKNGTIQIMLDYLKTENFAFAVEDIVNLYRSEKEIKIYLNNDITVVAIKDKRVDIYLDDPLFTEDNIPKSSLVNDVEIINLHYINLSTRTKLEIDRLIYSRLGFGRWFIDSFKNIPVTLYRKKTTNHGFVFGLWDIEKAKPITKPRALLKV